MTSSSNAFDVHIAGFGVETGLGFGHARLLQAIGNGESAARTSFFGNPFEAGMAGFGFNPEVVPLRGPARKSKGGYHQALAEDVASIALKVIVEALDHASIPVGSLSQKRVCVFYGGPGVQPETANFLPYIRRNDRDDISFHRGIRNLTFENHNQDEVARLIHDELGLRERPVSVYSASCSSFAAAYLAHCSVKSNACDLAIAVSFQHVSLFDLMFMNGFGGVAAGRSGPFSANGEGTILGDGACAMVLESPAHLHARKGEPYASMDSMAMRQSAGTVSRSSTFTPDFRIIEWTIAKAMEDAYGLGASDIACVFPHGNGIRSSDRSEALALQKVWGALDTPVVSYKAQIGYLMASSALVDLAIMSGYLDSGSLPAFTCEGEVDVGLSVNLHANKLAHRLSGNVGIKIGLGIEGSVGAAVVRSLRSRSISR